MKTLTQKRLKEVLSYNEETGVFIWKIDRQGTGCRKGKKANAIETVGYSVICIDKQKYKAHRLVFLYVYGNMPEHQVDYINHIKTDNRFCNLRLATISENQRNRRINKNNTSGFYGVNWCKQTKSWRVRITVNSKEIHLGRFKQKEYAIKARQEAEKKYGFHPNHGSQI